MNTYILIIVLLIVAVVLYLIYDSRQQKTQIKRVFEPVAEPFRAIDDDLMAQILDSANQTAAWESYKPIGLWTGRLILPASEQRQGDDSVFFHVHNASPNFTYLVGTTVRLRWSQDPQVQHLVRELTYDVQFTEKTIESKKAGNVHPDRLNNWQRVGPLESLAGAREDDDVIVMLSGPVAVAETDAITSLIIRQEPVQISGRIVALVTFIQPIEAGSDRLLVRHYNKTSEDFDGAWEIIRLPQPAPSKQLEVPFSTNHLIEKSPLNASGWYVYGERDPEGVFVTQAIEPRSIMLLKPDEMRLDLQACQGYLLNENWKNTAEQKGLAKTVLLAPEKNNANTALSEWKEGDKAIVIHAFGGLGGKKTEKKLLGTTTGHFAYGIARVIKDSFTDDLRFDIDYWQVYCHNPDGIISGPMKWCHYMGDLNRGFLGIRPVADILVKFDPVTTNYHFDGINLSPLSEFKQQLHRMTARYRVGDGTGAAILTPARSCVQDSNQALYVTIERIESIVTGKDRYLVDTEIESWMQENPNDPETLRFNQLAALARSLEKELVPLGFVVQPDWRRNVEMLAGTAEDESKLPTTVKALTTWRTIFPRRAQDEIASILLKHQASLWVIRTNQVGGFNPDIDPVAPTTLLKRR